MHAMNRPKLYTIERMGNTDHVWATRHRAGWSLYHRTRGTIVRGVTRAQAYELLEFFEREE